MTGEEWGNICRCLKQPLRLPEMLAVDDFFCSPRFILRDYEKCYFKTIAVCSFWGGIKERLCHEDISSKNG